MQMLQDGPYATAPEKPLRMTGSPEACRVSYISTINICCYFTVFLWLALSGSFVYTHVRVRAHTHTHTHTHTHSVDLLDLHCYGVDVYVRDIIILCYFRELVNW